MAMQISYNWLKDFSTQVASTWRQTARSDMEPGERTPEVVVSKSFKMPGKLAQTTVNGSSNQKRSSKSFCTKASRQDRP